ncbi:MAG: SMC-Scp complex subunit ScpB [Candidatus Omnitrophica bacterium]|nr:SMC-Scp complex subunit ScpB [Candidatus Omnitrophota bacterium]
MIQDNNRSVIEALLFSSEKPLLIEQIRKVLDNLDPADIRMIIEDLKKEYEDNSRGIRIIEVAGGFQMVTSADFAVFLKKLYKQRKIERLSKPALETLAIIAYKQPVTKFEIESLRSVNIDGVVESLTDKGLIRIVGRKKAPGRPFVFGTTRQFLEHFGLRSLEELPRIENLAKIIEEKTEQPAQAETAMQGPAQKEETVSVSGTEEKSDGYSKTPPQD